MNEEQEFPFQRLPEELKYVIFCWLATKDLGRATQVCHEWHAIVEDQTIWKNMYTKQLKFNTDFPS